MLAGGGQSVPVPAVADVAGARGRGVHVRWALPWLAGAGVSVCSPTGEGYTVLSGWKRRLGMGFDRLFSSMLQPVH